MVSIVVEDGSLVSNANSYVTTAELQTYADNRNITISGDLSELLIQSMDYIESLSYQGYKFTRDQALQWPRTEVYIDSYMVDADQIPQELKNGQMATALAIDAGNGPLVALSPSVKRKKVGELEIEYTTGSTGTSTDRNISSSLWKLLAGGGRGSNCFKVSKA